MPAGSQQDGQTQGNEANFVHQLALVVVISSFIVLAATAGLAIGFSKDQSEATRLVFVSILPLFGTWVGTVLAYYFAKENLKQAADTVGSSIKATADLAGLWTPTTLVKDAMTPANRVETYSLHASEILEDIGLRGLWDRLDGRPFDGIPIVNDATVPQAFIARTDLTQFAATNDGKVPEVFDTAKIRNLATTPEELKKLLHRFVTASPETTLGAASDKLATVPDAKTILVTTDGTENTTLQGIVTSSDIITKMKR
jgi:hypothetical protein